MGRLQVAVGAMRRGEGVVWVGECSSFWIWFWEGEVGEVVGGLGWEMAGFQMLLVFVFLSFILFHAFVSQVL